jgi:hypothetical protein
MRSSDAPQGRTFLGGGPTSDRIGWTDGGGGVTVAEEEEAAAIADAGEGPEIGVGPRGGPAQATAAIARKRAKLRIGVTLGKGSTPRRPHCAL